MALWCITTNRLQMTASRQELSLEDVSYAPFTFHSLSNGSSLQLLSSLNVSVVATIKTDSRPQQTALAFFALIQQVLKAQSAQRHLLSTGSTRHNLEQPVLD
jgi:hypothetical protein